MMMMMLVSNPKKQNLMMKKSATTTINNRMNFNDKRLIFGLFITITIVYFTSLMMMADAYPTNLMMTRKYPVNVEVENPEELISTLDQLIQNILVGIYSSHSTNLNNNNNNEDNNYIIQHTNDNNKSMVTNKRGIDLGLSRGFSGSKAAKHLMGISAASFGPGRRRRR